MAKRRKPQPERLRPATQLAARPKAPAREAAGFDPLDALVIVTDRRGRLRGLNRAALAALRRRDHAVRGKSMRSTLVAADNRAEFSAAWAEWIRGEPVRVTLNLTSPRGPAIPVRLGATLEYDARGGIARVILTGHDVSEEVAAARELDQTRQRLQRVVDHSPIILWAVDREGLFTLGEGAGMRTLGLSPGAWVGRSIFEMYQHNPLVCTAVRRVLSGETFTQHIAEGGGEWHTQFVPMRNAEGAINGAMGVSVDVTQLARAERSQELLKLLVRRSPLGIIIWDKGFHVAGWNPAASRIFGYTEKEAMGMHATPIIPEPVRPYVDRIWENLIALRGGERSRNENLTKDGRTILCEWYNTPLTDDHGRVVAVASMVEDVTERAQAHEELIRREAELRLITDNIPAFIASVGPDGAYRFCNRWFQRVTDDPASLKGRPIGAFLDERSRLSLQPFVNEALAGRPQHFESAYRDHEGEPRPVEITYVPRFERGEPDGFYALGLDVTERRQAERAVAESEARFRQMAEAVHNVIWISDIKPEFCVRYVNPAFERIWGLKAEDLYREPWLWSKSIIGEDRTRVQTAFRAMVDGATDAYDVEYRIQGAHGQQRWIHDRGFRVSGEAGRVGRVAGIAEDITERKNAERELAQYRDHLETLVEQRGRQLRESMDKLRQSERLASLGTLAAGLGHDMNNMILPMRCVLEPLLGDPDLRHHGRGLTQLQQSIDFLGQLATSLLQLAAAPDDAQAGRVRTEPAAWWAGSENMLRATLPATARLEVQVEPGLPAIPVRADQLSRAVLNLLINGAEAAGKNPLLRLAITGRPAPTSALERWVDIAVTDNGPGMSEFVRAHAFDPFFTTKTRALSTGLGLSLVRAVVEAAGGQVDIHAQPGQGTTVTLSFPGVAPADTIHARGGAEKSPPVCVTLKELRIQSYVTLLLKERGFEICEDRSNQGELVWIAEADCITSEGAVHFLRGGESRRIILAGPGFESWTMDRTRRLGDVSDIDRLVAVIREPAT